jgi:hypothetical protein
LCPSLNARMSRRRCSKLPGSRSIAGIHPCPPVHRGCRSKRRLYPHPRSFVPCRASLRWC